MAILAVASASVTKKHDLPPSCQKPVYCDSDLLHFVQMARLYPDSKTFVDFHLKYDQQTTLNNFEELMIETNRNPSKEQIQQFVDDNFDSGNEIEDWTPNDFVENPKFLDKINDEKLREFGKDVHLIWPTLGRKIKQEVLDNPEQYSLIPVSHGFIIPGGRFKEIYYWDTYWIVHGLLVSDMTKTAKGVIENMIELLRKLGHIPNGSRWYYEERSQPPMLIPMVALYMSKTNDEEFLKENIDALEEELYYWLNTQTVTFDRNGKTYTLLRYNSPSAGPRPESYYEDYVHGQIFQDEDRLQEFYTDIKGAAESGWDFSSRWFIDEQGGNSGNLTNIHTKYIIPVELNAIFANNLQIVARFQSKFRLRNAARWGYLAAEWKNAINEVLWDDEDGIWYDYDLKNEIHRKYFFPTNVAPLWTGVVSNTLIKEYAPRVVSYLRQSSGLDFPGGVPSSLDRTGEQWDFPNAWPPLVSILINALEALETPEASEMAFHVAEQWVRANRIGFLATQQMFEKYDVEIPGQVGGGGEYTVQEGFGWSNGVILELLAKYGKIMTAEDSDNDVNNNP